MRLMELIRVSPLGQLACSCWVGFCGPVWHGRDLWITNWPKPKRDFRICCLVLCWGHVAAISHWLGV